MEPGAAGQVLISNGQGKPFWDNISTGDSILYSDFTTVGTDANTNEKVLGSYIMPGNTLNIDGTWIEIDIIVTINTSVTANSYIRLKFNGYIIFSTYWNGPINGSTYGVHSRIYRINVNSQKSYGSLVGFGFQNYNVLFKNLSNNLVIEFTGQSYAGNANDIVIEGIVIKLIR